MLVLAVLGLLAVPPADTSLRLPGTTLRFGLADSLMAARGFQASGTDTRRGPCRFFGLEGQVVLRLAGGHLTRAEVTVEEASPHQLDYVRDQLAAMGYRRRCETLDADASACDWSGRTEVHLVIEGPKLVATISPPAPVVAGPPAAGGTMATLPPPGSGATAPVQPETLTVRVPGRPSHYAEANVLEAPHCPWSDRSRAAGVQGRVWTLALVDVDGSVMDAHVTRGIAGLDTVALECVRRWRLAPRVWQGAACRYWVEVPVTITGE